MQKPADIPRFVQVFSRLTLALPDPNPDPSGLKLETYFDVLAEWPLPIVEAAAGELAKTGGAFFPSTAIWSEACRLQSVRTRGDSDYRRAVYGEALPALPAARETDRQDARAQVAWVKAEIERRQLAKQPKRGELALVEKLFPRDKVVCQDCGITVSDPEHKPDCPKVLAGRA